MYFKFKRNLLNHNPLIKKWAYGGLRSHKMNPEGERKAFPFRGNWRATWLPRLT